jgi:uncharacterized protein (DUF1330 family)
MNTRSKLLVLPALLAMAVGNMFAGTAPAFVVQAVSTDDAEAYNGMITKINAVIKAKTGLEKLRHVWVGDFAGENSHGVFIVSSFPSAAATAELTAKMKDDPDMKPLMEQLKGMRKLGPSWLYKGVRNDGLYEGGAVFNTNINCSDEEGYAKALDGLKAILDANGFKDAKVNLWRVVSGRKESTHLVIIAFPSEARVAELIDNLWDNALLKDWNVGASKVRTSLSNGTYHEITK